MKLHFLIGLLLITSSAEAQQSCTISGNTMTCPNGVTINGIGTSVIIGGKALNPGTGDLAPPDGREVHQFGNSGVIIGGQGQAERLTPAAPACAPGATCP